MKNGILSYLLVALSIVTGYTVVSRCLEENRDFR